MQTSSPCDVPVEASTDPTVPYTDDSQLNSAPDATMNDWNKDNAASFDFPIGVSPGELRPGLNATNRLDETAIGVGGVSVEHGNAHVYVMGNEVTGVPPTKDSGGCTNLDSEKNQAIKKAP
ncbi:MAG: hypothetical protein U1E36_01680 [Rickettsiales bacterium]